MWNERYATDEYVFGTAPSQFMQQLQPLIRPGQNALAVADGEGRNSVWLAQQGLQVTAFDFSANALSKARKLADSRQVQVDFQEADITRWDWQARPYDLVAAVFIQFVGPDGRDQIFEGLKQAVKPGGLIALHGYTPKQLDYGTGGPSSAQNMYTTDLLQQAFSGFEMLRLHAYEADIQEGPGHHGRSALIDMIARKAA